MRSKTTNRDYNFAYSDREIDSINKARNIKDGFTYFKGISEHGNGEQESGILVAKNGQLLRDNEGRLIIELPSSASQQGSPIGLYLKQQIGFINQVAEQPLYPVKILFPYKLGAWHWNVGEIIISQNPDGSFNVSGCKYDSYGSIDQLEPNMRKDIQDCLDQNLHGNKKYFHSNQCGTKIKSVQTGEACGLYAAIAMHNLKTKPVGNIWDGISLQNNNRKSEQHLRGDDYDLMQQHNNAELVRFCRHLDFNPPKKPKKPKQNSIQKTPSTTTKPYFAQNIRDVGREQDAKNALVKWFGGVSLNDSEKIYVNAAKAAMATQLSNPKPNEAYTGIGVDVEVSSDKASLKIIDIFSPEDGRFLPQLLKGQSITAVKVGGKMVSIKELIEQDASLKNIAEIFHDVNKGQIEFVVLNSAGQSTNVTCERNEKSCFVTNDCKEAKLGTKRGEKFDPNKHSAEVFHDTFGKNVAVGILVQGGLSTVNKLNDLQSLHNQGGQQK